MEDAAPAYVLSGRGWAKVKRWKDQGNAWRMSRKQVRIMGLSATMSPSFQGYYAMDDQGKVFHSADVVQGADPPLVENLPELVEPGVSQRRWGGGEGQKAGSQGRSSLRKRSLKFGS